MLWFFFFFLSIVEPELGGGAVNYWTVEIQQNVEVLLQELESITVNIPELKLLRQYHGDAVSWISHFNDVHVNIHEREDQENVVDELQCILKQGLLLRIQGLPLGMCRFLFFIFMFKNSYCSLSWCYMGLMSGFFIKQSMSCLLWRLSWRRLIAGKRLWRYSMQVFFSHVMSGYKEFPSVLLSFHLFQLLNNGCYA